MTLFLKVAHYLSPSSHDNLGNELPLDLIETPVCNYGINRIVIETKREVNSICALSSQVRRQFVRNAIDCYGSLTEEIDLRRGSA